MIFVNSMSDIFHDAVPEKVIIKLFSIMNCAEQHTFQVLTKRAERLKKLSPKLPWAKNIWMGVTVENQKASHRIEKLRQTGAHTKFLSMEPLLVPFTNADFSVINWVIVGGESGPGARPMKEEWVLEIKDQCELTEIPFFFKQWGGVNKKKTGRLLLDRSWDGMPVV
jgi:protein gp37